MLSRFEAHLKNNIIIKLVVFVIVVIVLLYLFPKFKEDLANSYSEHEKMLNLLQNAELKFRTLSVLNDEIIKVSDEYKNVVENSWVQSRITQNKLDKNLKIISTRYSLPVPISLFITQIPNDNLGIDLDTNIKIKRYKAKIQYDAKDEKESLLIMKDIIRILPNGSTVFLCNVKKTETLTQDVISLMKIGVVPRLMSVKLSIELKDIVYEK